MFNAEELQLLICGSEEGVNVDDMKAHTEYAGVNQGAGVDQEPGVK